MAVQLITLLGFENTLPRTRAIKKSQIRLQNESNVTNSSIDNKLDNRLKSYFFEPHASVREHNC